MRGGVFLLLLWAGLVALAVGCFSAAKEKGAGPIARRDLNLTYTFTLKIPSGSERVNIWIPLPRSDGNQNLKNFKITGPLRYFQYIDREYGNTILKLEGLGNLPESLHVKLDLNVFRLEQTGNGSKVPPPAESNESLERFLQADRLVPIDGPIAEEARRVVKPEMFPLEKARAIYDYVVETMAYDKSGTGWGRGDALWACDARKGNCTDFHSFFIGMARASGIPARFVMGFPVPEDKKAGEISGYHCWAEFYIPEMGWIPVDASEAWKHPEKKEFFFGNLDPNRVAFTLGRDIRVDAKLEPLNYLIYPYILIDGREISEFRSSVRFADRLN